MVTDIPEVRHVSEVRLYGNLDDSVERPTAGWEKGEGEDELQLDQEDLFHVVRVRIQTEDPHS